MTVLYRLYYEVVRWSIYLVSILVFGVRYYGRHNIPSTGGALMVSNHQSHLDPPLVGIGVPRLMGYVARASLFRIRLLAPLMRSTNAFPIEREGTGVAGIKESLRRLKRGEMVLIFPEGTRTPDGEIKRFLPGFTTLAVRTGAAIVPAAIEGSFGAWPRCSRLPRRHRIHIGYGPPLLPDEIEKYDDQALVAEVERRVRACQEDLRRHKELCIADPR